jgi:hypothetical protein
MTTEKLSVTGNNTMLNCSLHCCALLDCHGRYVSWTEAWDKTFQFNGQNLREICHFDKHPEDKCFWEEFCSCFTNGEIHKFLKKAIRRNDGFHYCNIELRPWFDGKGTVIGVAMFVEDMTKNIQLEKQNESLFGFCKDLLKRISIQNFPEKLDELIEFIPSLLQIHFQENDSELLWEMKKCWEEGFTQLNFKKDSMIIPGKDNPILLCLRLF